VGAALALALVTACGGAPPVSETPTAEALRVLLEQGPGSNVAVTAPNGREAALRPWVLPAPVHVVQPTLERVIGTLPRWRVAGRRDGVIWAERTTRLFRFVDDVYLLCREREGETVVEIRSASRVGRGDLGQNRRNIRELWRGMQGFLEAHHPPIPPRPGDPGS
jgi:uncharacterized protein (DUF1499 family)